MKVEGERHFCLKSIEVILSNLLSFALWNLKLSKYLFAPSHALPELIAVKFNDSSRYLSRLFESVIIVIGKLTIKYLVDVERATSLNNGGLVSLQNVFYDCSSVQGVGLSRDRIHWVVVVH